MSGAPGPPEDGAPFLVYDPSSGAFPGDRRLGGKGATLCALRDAGFPVPPFFCVTTWLLDEIQGSFREELTSRFRKLADAAAGDSGVEESVREASEFARGRLSEVGLSPRARATIQEAFDGILGEDAVVSVRSSVVGEDSAQNSFAGQMSTFLFVRTREVGERIVDCLASAFSEEAILYRHARGLLERPVEAGVVIQEMIDAEKSGVAFTADPVSGDPSIMVFSAGYGLGEGVVADRVEVDTLRIDKVRSQVIRREIPVKSRRVVRDESGSGTRMEIVPEGMGDEAVLSEQDVAALTELAGRVEAWAEAPCDLEWSFDADGKLWLLQSRPLTTGIDGRVTILDNSNIIESYPGVSTPLTFSFVRRGYGETFREGMRMLGVSPAALRAESTLFQNLIAYVEGRIYYNILHWYQLYDLMGLERAIPAWEKALGLSRGTTRDDRATRPGPWRKVYIRWRMARWLFARDGSVRAYLDTLAREEERMRGLDLSALTGHELIELLERLTDRLLAPYGIAIVNDLFAQQLYDRVGRLLDAWGIGDPESLRNAIVVGPLRSDAVLPVRSLTDLAREIRENEGWRSLFESEPDPKALWDRIRGGPEFAGIQERVETHVTLYGDRTVQELKLETPSLREDPAFALHHLRSYVLSPPKEVRSDPERGGREAEERVHAALRLRPVRRFFFFRLLHRTRDAIRYRESLRLARTRAFGLVKRIYGALGARFERQGILERRRDIFFLTAEEVEGAVWGHGVSDDLRALVALRKKELARHEEAEAPPPRIVVRGPVRAMRRTTTVGPAEAEGEELQGEGCSPGVVTGPALVVREPRRNLDASGKILIAPATDPGWVFLMVAARGLVVERGSVLSHTAIVGRELGIPTVVGVADATRRIRDGDQVRMDGSTGAVRLLGPEAAPDPG